MSRLSDANARRILVRMHRPLIRAKVVRVELLVLVLAFLLVTTVPGPAKSKAKAPRSHDLADIIAANPILTSFAKVMQASDLTTFLSSKGPFTVFAPTDSAFDKLQPGVLDALLRPENKERLQHILLFHIISSKELAVKDLLPLRAIFSAEGNPLTFKTSHTGVSLVSKARITHADIHCSNGMIDEIDTVLMPPEGALPPLKFVADAAPAPAAGQGITPVPATGDPAASNTNVRRDVRSRWRCGCGNTALKRP